MQSNTRKTKTITSGKNQYKDGNAKSDENRNNQPALENSQLKKRACDLNPRKAKKRSKYSQGPECTESEIEPTPKSKEPVLTGPVHEETVSIQEDTEEEDEDNAEEDNIRQTTGNRTSVFVQPAVFANRVEYVGNVLLYIFCI
jgi:hypothetical protein